MSRLLALRLMVAALLALTFLFLGPILVTSLWLRLGLLVIALLFIAEGARRIQKRKE
jgi:hypothetical protein